MTNNFINWVVDKIVRDINCMRPSHRGPVVESIQVSNGLIGMIELSLQGWVDEYNDDFDDCVCVSCLQTAAETIHRALRNKLAQE